MIKRIECQNLDGVRYTFQYDSVLVCPMCHHAIDPIVAYASCDAEHKHFSTLNVCPACSDYFITRYYAGNLSPHTLNTANFKDCSPVVFERQNFNEHITSVSPSFVEIYNQAFEAEHCHLDEIAGIGYRKAIEFLIKDYLISENPDNSDEIKSLPLGKCIDQLDNEQLKTVSRRAVWLGNDQTHYVQKFEDKDINDLKRLISLTIHWISMLLETKEAEAMERR